MLASKFVNNGFCKQRGGAATYLKNGLGSNGKSFMNSGSFIGQRSLL